MKMHHATVEPATESDNIEWVYIDCETEDAPFERVLKARMYTQRWDLVSCKNCLRRKPKENA